MNIANPEKTATTVATAYCTIDFILSPVGTQYFSSTKILSDHLPKYFDRIDNPLFLNARNISD